MRLERQQELSFLEFNYMILQAYDFVELNKRQGCVLQMGGSDQWGNIINGIDLGRRMLNTQLFALTTPLITTSSGAKMGKTAAGAVWLNADLVSPYDYWQFWRNTDDSDVARFLKLFTVLPLDEIARLAALRGQEINEAKKVLATEATAHGPRPRRRRAPPPKPRGGPSKKARSPKVCRRSMSRAANSNKGSACWPPSSRPVWSLQQMEMLSNAVPVVASPEADPITAMVALDMPSAELNPLHRQCRCEKQGPNNGTYR